MPLNVMRRVWDYSTFNKPFFILILILFILVNTLPVYIADLNSIVKLLCIFLPGILISGYGLSITRDRINHGKRLPKIMINDVIVFGLKSLIVSTVYLFIQGVIMDSVCSSMNFPAFDLEEMLLEFPHTVNMLYRHDHVYTVIFLVLGSILFYISVFFMEIALAKLADTGSIIESFNLLSIKRSIDIIGWRDYVVEYTLIVLAIVIFESLKYIVIPVYALNFVWRTILSLFAFTTQYLGIGAVYSKVKDN